MMALKSKPAAKKKAVKRSTSVRLDPEHEKRLDSLAEEWGTTRSAIVQIALARFLKNPGK